MTDQPINPLAVARDIAQLEDHLIHITAGLRYGSVGDCDSDEISIAAGFLTLLRALQDGQEPLTAVAAAVRDYQKVAEEMRKHRDASRARSEREYEARQQEEEITRKVECPYCGAAPQATCRTAGPARAIRSSSHSDRFRLARGLLGPSPTQTGERS